MYYYSITYGDFKSIAYSMAVEKYVFEFDDKHIVKNMQGVIYLN